MSGARPNGTPSVARLGHVGIHAFDIEKEKAFYRDVIGLQITDENPEVGMVFMSAQPEVEHHEFLICGGRNVQDEDALLLQQVSFRCNSLDDVIGYYRRLKQYGARFDMIVSHGNAVGVYFRDPEGNRCELYWNTGLKARQPYLQSIDLEQEPDEIMRQIRESVAQYGETGVLEDILVEGQDLRH